MARKLKTYQTSLGFFDLAIAAPSMKAALEAWDSNRNLFHQGFAKETADPAIVKATMDKPGVVLRRPVGSNGAFTEHAELPSDLSTGKGGKAPTQRKPKVTRTSAHQINEKTARQAALTSERERKRLDAERRAAEAARERQARRRLGMITKLEESLAKLSEDHAEKVVALERERAALDQRLREERLRWEKQKAELEAKLRQMRD